MDIGTVRVAAAVVALRGEEGPLVDRLRDGVARGGVNRQRPGPGRETLSRWVTATRRA